MGEFESVLKRYVESPVIIGGDDPQYPWKKVSSVGAGTSLTAMADAWGGVALPDDLVDLWLACGEANLMADPEGQWGLRILSPAASRARTAQQMSLDTKHWYRESDIVIAEFLGDLDVLVLAPSEEGDRRLLVALPLDEREEWYGVGPSIAQFLANYYDAVGEKYWEE